MESEENNSIDNFSFGKSVFKNVPDSLTDILRQHAEKSTKIAWRIFNENRNRAEIKCGPKTHEEIVRIVESLLRAKHCTVEESNAILNMAEYTDFLELQYFQLLSTYIAVSLSRGEVEIILPPPGEDLWSMKKSKKEKDGI